MCHPDQREGTPGYQPSPPATLRLPDRRPDGQTRLTGRAGIFIRAGFGACAPRKLAASLLSLLVKCKTTYQKLQKKNILFVCKSCNNVYICEKNIVNYKLFCITWKKNILHTKQQLSTKGVP